MAFLNLDRPLVFFDLEATGISPAYDRIIEIALIKVPPQGTPQTYASLINPEFAIPAEATEVCHITDAMVAGAPTFKEAAPAVAAFIGEADLAGFNIVKYDVPLLQEEFKRAGFPFSVKGRRLVDALVIFRKMERRDLAAACRFYLNRPHEGSHRALADTQATLEVLGAQVERYRLPRDVGALSALSTEKDPSRVDGGGKFIWRNGEAVFNFGKHKMVSLREISRADPGYLQWLSSDDKISEEMLHLLREALAGRFPVKPPKAPPPPPQSTP